MSAELTVGILTLLANVGITWFNHGKNRTIYDMERVIASGDHKHKEEQDIIKPKLKSGKYTILNTFQDAGNTRNTVYILGKIKK